ncbi:MAG: hypothetical protein QOI41_4185 [Myxococcales bacterium]|nr:hypothetical protein [Myxococcales bacterium]
MRRLRLVGSVPLSGALGVFITLVVAACAKGTDNNGILDEGGLVDEDAGRDVNVIPVPKDSSTMGQDGTVLPPDDSGGTCTMKVVINEVKTDGTTANDEMVELYNPSACAVPLGSWEIKYESASGGTGGAGHKFLTGDSIDAKGYLVLTPGGSTNWTAGMAKTDGQLGLLDDKGALVDGVGWGTITGGSYKESTAATAPASGGSIGRSPNGSDTGNNKIDFKTYPAPSPGAPNP